jgi:hypothetical protein
MRIEESSNARMRSFVLGSVGMLCATFIGFVSEIRPPGPGTPDRGYDATLETQSRSPAHASFSMSGVDDGPALLGASEVRAAIARGDGSSTANFYAKKSGGDHVE